MTPERWQEIKLVLGAVLERSPEERASFLNQACGHDELLRAEVESLMAHKQPGDSVVNSLGMYQELGALDAAEQQGSDDESTLESYQRIGPYKVLRELGHGGVGAVYLAARADDQYRQQVAIKLIRRGMDTDFVLRRFRNERQILAALDHPNIARLLDGGSTENHRPYLVMEYIEGVPIDTYCDSHRLSTEERLKLFQQVCGAVHYAHQHLVIHRDIKPSNILVTKESAPKLLDFGIAKLLSPELAAQTLDHTGPSLRLMTPAYASPEQIRGQPITTATDVYSLGVLLYELLTGHHPYRVQSHVPLELMQAVLGKEPTRPSTAIMTTETSPGPDGSASIRLTPESVSSTREGNPDRLRRSLRGDLDNIVLMALRKDPQRRYASVQQFSEDIRRHLARLPVIARGDGLAYRTSKFIRRNRVGVAAATMILFTLVGGIIAVNQQRRRAERRFNDVRQLAHSVVFDYHDAIADLPGSTPVRQRMVRDALKYLDSLASEASNDQGLQRELATAYRKIGDVQGNSNMANLGDTTGALISYRKSLAIRQALTQSQPDNKELQIELAESYERIGDAQRTTADVVEADKNYQHAIGLLEKASTGDSSQQRRLADLLYRVGNLKGYPRTANLGDTKGALEFHGRAQVIRESLSAANPNDINLRIDLAESHRSIANILAAASNDLTAAEPHARQAVSIAQSLVSTNHTSARTLRVLTEAQDALARLLMLNGQTTGALEVCLKSLETAERMLAIDPKNMQARQDLASGHTLAGNICTKMGDGKNALRHHRESLLMNQAITADDPTNEAAKVWIGQNYLNIGSAFAETHNLQAALGSYQQAVTIFEGLRQKKPGGIQAIQFVARAYDKLGETRLKLGDLKAALESLRHSVEFAEQSLARDSANDIMRRLVAVTYSNLGEVRSRLAAQRKAPESERNEQWLEARKAYQRSLDLFLDLRDRGVLTKEFYDKPEQVTLKIAACDAALRHHGDTIQTQAGMR
ncbi:MAG TPA: protein kinase [Pyrinomonadaceae bacterium]